MAGTHTPLKHAETEHCGLRQPDTGESYTGLKCTSGRVLQQAQVCLAQAAAVLRRQLVDLGADSLYRIFGDGGNVRTALLPQVLQTVLQIHQ